MSVTTANPGQVAFCSTPWDYVANEIKTRAKLQTLKMVPFTRSLGRPLICSTDRVPPNNLLKQEAQEVLQQMAFSLHPSQPLPPLGLS